MTGKYFQRMDIISWMGTLVRNITARVNLLRSVRQETDAFYPYTMKNKERADTISYDYYGDSGYDWLVYLTNNIIDPDYDMPLDEDNLNNYVTKKYGSIANAQQFILYYQNDWVGDDSNLTPSAFNALPSNLKKYWTAQTDQNDNVIGYVRIQDNLTVSTNQIVTLTTNVASNTVFIKNEYVKQGNTAKGQLAFGNSSTIIVQCVAGAFVNGSITTSQSNVTANVSNVSVYNNIDPTEVTYWAPVYAYDYEVQNNNANKEIRLLDKRFLSTVDSDMQRLFQS